VRTLFRALLVSTASNHVAALLAIGPIEAEYRNVVTLALGGVSLLGYVVAILSHPVKVRCSSGLRAGWTVPWRDLFAYL
jgi:hypothetical protein